LCGKLQIGQAFLQTAGAADGRTFARKMRMILRARSMSPTLISHMPRRLRRPLFF
jgi:hypothetical protein